MDILVLKTKHAGNRRTADVDVEKTDVDVFILSKGKSNLSRHGGFADTTFAT